jgi:hypothetical protein
MATQFTDGFPNDPLQAIHASTFLTAPEQQEWMSWLTSASPEDKDELVTTLHELWKEQQQAAAPATPVAPPPAPVAPPAPQMAAPLTPPPAAPQAEYAQMPPRAEPPRATSEPRYTFAQETPPAPREQQMPPQEPPREAPRTEQPRPQQQPSAPRDQQTRQERPQNSQQPQSQQSQNQSTRDNRGQNGNTQTRQERPQNSQQPQSQQSQNQSTRDNRGQYSFASDETNTPNPRPAQSEQPTRPAAQPAPRSVPQMGNANLGMEQSTQKSRFVDLNELRSSKTKSVLESIYTEYNKQKEDQDKVIRKVMDTVLSQEELLNYVDEIAARMITLNDSWVEFTKREQAFKEEISNRLDDQSARLDETQSQIDMLGVTNDKTNRELRVFKTTMQKELSELKINYAAAAGDMYKGTDGMNEKISWLQKEIEKLKGNPINSVQGRFDYLRQQNSSLNQQK